MSEQTSNKTHPKPAQGYLRQGWLVIVLSLSFGAALATVDSTLGPLIKENKQKATLAQVPQLVPGADSGQMAQAGGKTVYKATAGGKHVGWVVPTKGAGFADVIEILIGLDEKAAKITGLYVLDQKETPGLGDKIRDPKWRDQFTGKSFDGKLAVVPSGAAGEQVNAVTGATISSVAVTDIVNRASADFKKDLQKD